MILCYLGLGSNLQTPERQIRMAISKIVKLPRTHLLAVAPFYHNPAMGRKAQPPFCNTVVQIQTHLPPNQLHAHCLAIEMHHHRIRKIRWNARTLDIDILYYGDRTIHTHLLTIPHPRIAERPFVLEPLQFFTKKNGVIPACLP